MKTTKPRHFINLPDIPTDQLLGILRVAHDLKKQKFTPPQILNGLSLAMLFDKRSTRTRVSFEVAMKQLGGHTVVMNKDDMQLGGAESVADTARVMSRFVDAIMVRISNHAMVEELAAHASIPIINALTDASHPCQIMADLITIEEKLGRLQGLKIAWFGDYNNVAKTFQQAAPIFGFDLILAVPEALQPVGQGNFTSDPKLAAQNADVLVTDTWVSMGQEGGKADLTMYRPFSVTPQLMALAKPHALFMHCMPIHKDEEVYADVLASPASVIYDEAENRLHAQKAILAWCLADAGVRLSVK